MVKNFRNAAIVAAVGAAFAGTAQGTAILGAGASAVKNSVQLLILKDYCTAGTINFYDNATAIAAAGKQPSGGVFRIQCTQTTLSQFSNAVDIGYDTTGGSWKGFTAVDTSMYTTASAQNTAFNANPVSTVPTTGCTGTAAGVTIAVLGYSFFVTHHYGCTATSLNPASQNVDFGLTDVEATLFLATADNQPLVNNSWATTSTGPTQIYGGAVPTIFGGHISEKAGFPQQVFGVVLGIAASPSLYSALQADQISAGLIPGAPTCTAGSVSSPASTCAPIISKAQYASIVANTGGAMNASIYGLFQHTALAGNGAFELARRDQGSGTQASSNAFFLNDGCTNKDAEAPFSPQLPVGSAGNVTYNATTTDVLTQLGAPSLGSALASSFVIGIVSVENESSLNSAAATGKGGTGSGFLKLEGVYPSAGNAALGLYGYVSEENLHANPAASGDAAQFLADLTNTTVGSPKVTESAYNYGSSAQPANGIVQLFSNLDTTAAYGNSAQLCNGWQHL